MRSRNDLRDLMAARAHWLENRTPTYGASENFVETFNKYINNGVTFFTCVFFDVNDMRRFKEEVISKIK